tara:strand:- start:887 stop:2203 length:1317 start_codon:yes stop_codon:yes gene_type:complete
MDENNPLGLDFTTPINPLEALSGLAQNVQRNVSSGLEFINGAVRHVPTFLTEVRESFTPEQQTEQTEIDRKIAISPENLGRVENQVSDTIASGIESTGDFLGVPRSISTPVAGAVAAIATPGFGDMKLAFGAGGVALTGAVTATNPRILRTVGVKTGASMYDTTGIQGKQLLRRDKRILEYKNTISIKNDEMKTLRELKGDPKNLQTFVDNASPELQKYWKSQKGDVNKIVDLLGDNKKNAQEGLSRVESNVLPFDTTKQAERIKDFRNVNYFRSNIGLSEKKLEETSRNIQGYLEQHHLFPKGMSAAFFGKMDDLIEKGVATKDDLILMAEFAAAKGRRAGDIKANLLNMQQTPHNRMHTELRAMGAELGKTDYQRLLKDVDNVDDLLDRWADIFEPGIEGDAVYNAAVAELWEPLDKLLMEISPAYTGTSKIKGLK